MDVLAGSIVSKGCAVPCMLMLFKIYCSLIGRAAMSENRLTAETTQDVCGLNGVSPDQCLTFN